MKVKRKREVFYQMNTVLIFQIRCMWVVEHFQTFHDLREMPNESIKIFLIFDLKLTS